MRLISGVVSDVVVLGHVEGQSRANSVSDCVGTRCHASLCNALTARTTDGKMTLKEIEAMDYRQKVALQVTMSETMLLQCCCAFPCTWRCQAALCL